MFLNSLMILKANNPTFRSDLSALKCYDSDFILLLLLSVMCLHYWEMNDFLLYLEGFFW